jgi:cytochrome c5
LLKRSRRIKQTAKSNFCQVLVVVEPSEGFRQALFHPSGFMYTARHLNTQSNHHGGERMSTDITRHRRYSVQVLGPALALLLLLGAGCSEKETTPPQETVPAQAPESEALPPVDAPELTDKSAATRTASADGQKIYQASCQACHATGVAGAPKLGDKAAWAPRIAKGNDAMLSSVKNGLKAMPPKGTCMSCSEDELRAAMEYMVGQGS